MQIKCRVHGLRQSLKVRNVLEMSKVRNAQSYKCLLGMKIDVFLSIKCRHRPWSKIIVTE